MLSTIKGWITGVGADVTTDNRLKVAAELVDSSETTIDPATEDKQDDAISELQSILSELQTVKGFDSGNSTATPLGIGGIFTGDWVDTSGYVQAIVDVITDQDAATDGLRFEYSDDGTNVRHAHSFSPLDNDPDGHHYATTLDSQYFRVKYTNGAVEQLSFRIITTIFKTAPEEGHVHPVNYVIDDDHQASIVRAILVGKKPDGSYINFGATTGGNQKISLEEYDDAVNPIRKNLEGVGDLTVGVAEVEIAITGTPTHQIRIRADVDNTGEIFIGKTGVLSDGSNDFVRLESGDEAIIPYNDATNALYAISDTAAQTINVGALL